MDIKKLVKKEVALLTAYHAKEVPCRIKLDANESPFGFAGAVRQIRDIRTNRYPDPEAKLLRRIIAQDLGKRPEQLLFGNGSDELIYYLIAAFGGPVSYPVPTFTMYGIIAQALGEKKSEVPLDQAFDLDADRFLSAIRKERPKLIFLSSPNNPTGNCFSDEKMVRILKASRGLVIVDEAYQPFAGASGMLPLLNDYPNLVIMRTLSKTGLAALRLGFMIAGSEIINEVNKVRLPFNVNAFSQAIAAAALRRKTEFRKAIHTIVAERALLFAGMAQISGVTPFPSEANFILFRVADPDFVYTALLKKGILVRNMKDVVRGCLRVTVGTPQENRAFLKSLAAVL